MLDKKSYVSNIFTRPLDTYDEDDPKVFAYFGRKLADFSPVSHDMNILDIGTGIGSVFYPILEELSHRGCLIGIDISDSLVDQVNTELLAYKIQNAVVINMNADNLEFHDDFFDLITCGLNIFFFDNITRVFAEIRRVLKETGYLTFTSWLKINNNQFDWYEEILQKYMPPNTYKEVKNTELEIYKSKDFFTPNDIEKVLLKNDFKIIRLATQEKTFFYSSAQTFWNKLWFIGEKEKLESIPKDKLEACKKEIFEKFNSLQGQNGFEFKLRVIYVSCQK